MSNLTKRIITGVVLVALLVPITIIPECINVFFVVAGFFTLVGAYEVMHLSEAEKKYSWRVKLVVAVSTLLVYLSGLSLWKHTQVATVGATQITWSFDTKLSFALILIAIILQLSLLVFSKSFDAKDIGKTFLAPFYVGFGVASLVALRNIGIRYIVYLLLITTFTDVFAYFFGMLFGKHKMVEHISPKKTWEGSVGGTIVATTIASLYAFLYGSLFLGTPGTILDNFCAISSLPVWARFIVVFFITLLASIVSQIGDLVASRLKRTYGIKDFGKIFPGHGGFLDRFDSAIYTAMFLLAAFLLLGVIIGIA